MHPSSLPGLAWTLAEFARKILGRLATMMSQLPLVLPRALLQLSLLPLSDAVLLFLRALDSLAWHGQAGFTVHAVRGS